MARGSRRSTRTIVATRRGIAGAAVLLLAAGFGAPACSRDPERSVDAFCAQVKAVKDFDQVLESGDLARIERHVADLRALQQVAPAEIEKQVGVLVGISDELAHTVATAKDPDLAAKEVFAKHQGDVASITDAGTAVQNYSVDTCHVSLNGTAGTTVPGTAPGTSISATTSTAKAARSTTTRAKPG